ncbi:MAG: hypothetical protein CMB70_05640 [Euryarchaeota archaeon]|jgi:DNA-directed RNA polymerase subunit K/omega|nr:hypothetical protein [Euryarchaeota archaeon]
MRTFRWVEEHDLSRNVATVTSLGEKMVKPARLHTRFERARIIGARALQIGMGAPLYAKEEDLREEFKAELISLYGLEEASVRFVLDPLKIAVYEYDNELIPIDIDPHLDE